MEHCTTLCTTLIGSDDSVSIVVDPSCNCSIWSVKRCTLISVHLLGRFCFYCGGLEIPGNVYDTQIHNIIGNLTMHERVSFIVINDVRIWCNHNIVVN